MISNGSGEMYMAWGQVGPEWTADRSTALWLVRRADAEALAAENEDAWSILPVERCALPPNGWVCTLAAGHEGPCPTIAAPTAQAMDTWAVIERVAKNWDGCSIGPAIRAEAEKVIGQPAQAVDLGDFKALYRAYVCLLESGRDRIRDLGGTCDPVDVMEANDVDLQAARRVLDSQAVGNG
ncbi:hypothetical protein ABW45_12385 [Stenotrophomonas maltophilia]|nr:hypothetical protein ABW45_12385 [Stenotrophomonas maltophilia]